MSDIKRFFPLWGSGGMMPANNGKYVRYADHRAEIERLTNDVNAFSEVNERIIAERDAAQAEVERLKNAIGYLTRERDEARDERDAAQRERDRVQDLLTLAGRELSTLREALRVRRRDQSDRRDKALARVKRLTHQNIERLKNALDQLTSERDEARAEVERLTVRLEHAQARIVPPLPHADESAQQVQDKMDGYIASLTTELRKTRHKLARVHAQYDEFAQVTAKVIAQHQRERDDARQQVYRLQQACADRPTDQSAQNLDMVANCKETLTSSRPTDEDIWREVFFRCVSEYITGEKRVIIADTMLAEYRKRWPR